VIINIFIFLTAPAASVCRDEGVASLKKSKSSPQRWISPSLSVSACSAGPLNEKSVEGAFVGTGGL
jgi:hypothetical protein